MKLFAGHASLYAVVRDIDRATVLLNHNLRIIEM